MNENENIQVYYTSSVCCIHLHKFSIHFFDQFQCRRVIMGIVGLKLGNVQFDIHISISKQTNLCLIIYYNIRYILTKLDGLSFNILWYLSCYTDVYDNIDCDADQEHTGSDSFFQLHLISIGTQLEYRRIAWDYANAISCNRGEESVCLIYSASCCTIICHTIIDIVR